MRAETLLFLPMAGRLRITDEYREHTYGTIATEAILPPGPPRPHHRARHRFTLDVDLGGGYACHQVFDDLGEAQAHAERFIRAHGALG